MTSDNIATRRFPAGVAAVSGLVGLVLGALATFAITGLVWTVRVQLPPPPYPPPLSSQSGRVRYHAAVTHVRHGCCARAAVAARAARLRSEGRGRPRKHLFIIVNVHSPLPDDRTARADPRRSADPVRRARPRRGHPARHRDRGWRFTRPAH